MNAADLCATVTIRRNGAYRLDPHQIVLSASLIGPAREKFLDIRQRAAFTHNFGAAIANAAKAATIGTGPC
jgi:hypothetical protein